MFNNSTPSSKPLVHLSRPASTSNEAAPHLPRGECRYILPANAEGSRERCSCASFNINEVIPGSQCQCGHQAWHHVQTPAGDFVPVEDHVALVDRCKKLEETARGLLDELKKEKKAREKLQADMNTMIRGAYGNMAFLRYYVDEKLEFSRITFEDKIEGALDRAADALNEVDRVRSRVVDLDEVCIRLEERLDSGRPISRSLTPVLEEKIKQTQLPLASLPLRSRSQDHQSESWDARIIVVPKKTQRWAFSIDSNAYKRCQSRGFHQDLHFETKGSGSFTKTVEAAFNSIFKNRPWMPLQCLNSGDMSLGQLHLDQRNPSLWTYAFLESQCMANDKEQGDVIYVALMHEEIGWPDIFNLPALFGYNDNSCWEPDEELDGKVINAHMDFKMDLDPTRVRNLETDSMYEYSPPPYSQRTSSEHRIPSALGTLADAALADQSRTPRTPSISDRSQYSGFSDNSHNSRHFAPSISDRSTLSGRSIEGTIYEEDEESSQGHRDKRPKHGALRQQPQPNMPSSPPATNSAKMYYSGRAKRKIDPAKQKEPLNWGVSDMKFSNPMKGILHRKHTGDGKDDAVSSDPPKADSAS